MKTFREYTTDDTLSPFFYQYGGSILGPGMGQYHPTADLNLRAQKEREVRKSDLDQLERYADRLFASLGIDVEFTKHFLDRVNDERNVKQITPSELTRLFKQTYKKHGKTIAKLGPDAEAVVNDMKTDINMPFVLNLKGGELELVAKTVMRKKDFKTSNRKLSFESYTRKTIKVGEDSVLGDGNPHYALVSDRKVIAIGTKEEMLELSDSQKGRVWLTKSKVGDIVESRAKKAVAGGKVQKLVTAHGLKFKGKVYKEIDMELVKINNATQMVTFNIIHPRELFGNETNISFRALRRGPFMATDTSKINESKQDKEYVRDIARAMRGKGHENLKKYADEFEKDALKSLNPRKELEKIPNIKTKQVANLLNMGEEMELTEQEIQEKIKAIANKAEKSGMPYSILKKVYDRGMAAYKGGHRRGATPQQWALARVNSFTTKSAGTWGKADKDLADKVRAGQKEEIEELETESLWKNIQKKRERIKRGSGERMRKKGEKGAPTAAQMKRAQEQVQEWFESEYTRKKYQENYGHDWWWKLDEVHDLMLDKLGIECIDCMGEKQNTNESEVREKAEYDGRPVKLNNPTRGDVKKYKVYVRNDKGNVVKVEYGDPNMEIKRDDPERRKNFRARHNCDNPGPKYKARYWSCKFWSAKSVTDLMKG